MNYYFVVYGLTLTSFIITVLAQILVNVIYNQYSHVRNERNLTGEYAARHILDKNGLKNV